MFPSSLFFLYQYFLSLGRLKPDCFIYKCIHLRFFTLWINVCVFQSDLCSVNLLVEELVQMTTPISCLRSRSWLFEASRVALLPWLWCIILILPLQYFDIFGPRIRRPTTFVRPCLVFLCIFRSRVFQLLGVSDRSFCALFFWTFILLSWFFGFSFNYKICRYMAECV
jgi:hypothetical protein